jgi:hypothetical protein
MAYEPGISRSSILGEKSFCKHLSRRSVFPAGYVAAAPAFDAIFRLVRFRNELNATVGHANIFGMRVFAFILAATICEAIGDTLMRMGLHKHELTGRVALIATATALLASYGALLNLAPVEFAEATGIYIACLFVMFQVTNYLFFRVVPTHGVLLGGAFILVGSTIIYLWR